MKKSTRPGYPPNRSWQKVTGYTPKHRLINKEKLAKVIASCDAWTGKFQAGSDRLYWFVFYADVLLTYTLICCHLRSTMLPGKISGA
ncbi:hypothetical protein EV363DRAFT_1398345 [Boletus edulis]|nr:hypothetical protein EV363DRAFT_1398345 [Boletus edulis]